MKQSHVETAYFHVETTRFHMEKSGIAASLDSKVLPEGHCHVAMTCCHIAMSRRCLPSHQCECAPAQSNVIQPQNHMPPTPKESALRRNLTSSSRHHMAVLQILLDRSFVLLGLLRSEGRRVEFAEHFECVLFEIKPCGFRIVEPKQSDNVRPVSSFRRCWIRRFNSGPYYIKRLKMRSGQKKI